VGPGGGRPVAEVGRGPSDLVVLGTLILNLALALLAVVMTPAPVPVPDPSVSVWVGFLAGLFGCTLVFGLLQVFVNQQREVGTFSDWNIPVSKVTIAKGIMIMGWAAGVVNCYVLAHNLASAIA
jgi:hypothetical protein